MVGTVSELIPSRLEFHEVQAWQVEKATSPSLGVYAAVKENWSEGFYLKMELAPEDLVWAMYVRGNFTPLGEYRKHLERDSPMSGEMGQSLHHFLGECREFKEMCLEIFGK